MSVSGHARTKARIGVWLVPALLGLLLVAGSATGGAAAAGNGSTDKVPVEISDRLKERKAPPRPTAAAAEAAVEASATTDAQCQSGDPTPETLVMELPSWDPAHPESEDVVFFKETADTATGKATLWVAWDFMKSVADPTGAEHTITCDQLEYLQSQMDSIVATDVKFFGDYVKRPAGNENIDVMIYDIKDESAWDPEFESYIAGFFWNSVNEQFNRNMVFIDSLKWEDYLGEDGVDPYRYEGTVAHELEHLIHNDHDFDEDSWVDEGMADLAEYLNGYGYDDGHVTYYLAFHRTPLTTWLGGLESYGASLLFQAYLLENFGGPTEASKIAWLHKLIDEQANSVAGIEAATGAKFNHLYDSWMVANYLDDPMRTGPGGYPLGYRTIGLTPFTHPTLGQWSIKRAITDVYGGDRHGALPVSRYFGGFTSGTVEYPLGEAPAYTPYYGSYKGIQPLLGVNFRGAAKSGVAPAEGSHEVFAGSSNMLTSTMALSVPVNGTLSFKTWFDIEEDWDFGFVEVSSDNGATWAPLKGSITRTSNNPFGSTAWANSLLGDAETTDAALTGSSSSIAGNVDGWVNGEFALPAGDVLVRFSYYTDEGTLGQGWFVDDVKVTGGGAFEGGFEAGSNGWNLGGWTRTTGLFSNDWTLAYVNPQYSNGKLTGKQVGFVDGGAVPATGNETLTTTLDTSRLDRDAAMVVFANRPGVNPFASPFRLLASKGNAAG